MNQLKLSELLEKSILPDDISVSGLALDSRKVQPGDLFFACQGTALDGRRFIDDAIAKGARAVLVDAEGESAPIVYRQAVPIIAIDQLNQHISAIAGRFYHDPANAMDIIGVTGTNGKTSCTYFIASVLQQLGMPCGVIGTMGHGLYGDIQSGGLTTPDAMSVQRILAEFKQQGAKHVAMEVSSHSLVQGRVEAIPFKVGVFTNLTQDHLDYHGTMEAYGAAKRRLFAELATQHAVINQDDVFGRTLIETLLPQKNIISYGLQKSTLVDSVYAENVTLDHGIRAHVVTPWGEGELVTALMGQFNLSNVLAVLAVLGVLGIPLAKSLACLKNLRSVPGRMETLGGHEQPLVVVDYSHTPDSLEKALLALRPHCRGQLYCVFGCGGNRDRGKRPKMAAIAEQLADYVIVTDDNPRTEDAAEIVADIMQGFRSPEKIIIQHDRSKAIYYGIQYAQRGDCVLIAGKGAETYQQIGENKIPFSDVEQVREILNARLAQ